MITGADTDLLAVLTELATDRIFSTGQAEQLGIHRLALVDLARRGVIHHLTRGYWAVGHPADPTDAHLLRTLAVLRRHRETSAATAHSALVLHGLPTVSVDLGLVHVQRETSQTTRRGRDFTIHAVAAPIALVGRPPVVSQPVPCVDLAAAIVLAGIVGSPDTALVAADAAIHRGLVTARELEVAAAMHHRGAKGISTVRRALVGVDGRRESPGESLTAQVCLGLGYVLEPQVWIGPWRVDFVIAGTKVIVEFDGASKYTSREDLLAEKRREDDLRARGYVVVRLIWADLRSPAKVEAKIQAGLRAAAA